MQFELATGERFTQITFEIVASPYALVHFLLEKTVGAASGSLCSVQGHIGVSQ